VDPPPYIPPDEKLSDDELARLALDLLRATAMHDPALAERMRRLGLDSGLPAAARQAAG
jgi:hypothetical protein